jgi:predicted Ser/Thr protein kinase
METWTKQSLRDTKWTFLTQAQAYRTELECLLRLGKEFHFPRLVAADPIRYTISTEYCGEPFRKLKKWNAKIYIKNPEKQVSRIISSLKKNNIVYLDMNTNGKNLCYNDGQIYLIDFDYCVIDNFFYNKKVKKLYKNFFKHGGYENLYEQIISIIKSVSIETNEE